MIGKIKALLKDEDSVEPIQDKQVIDKEYRKWRLKIMSSMLIGYATFYFIRKNMSVANKFIRDDFGFTKSDMGWILGIATIVYAISKFLSGVIADRWSPRLLMGLGLFASAIVSLFFGFSSNIDKDLTIGGISAAFLLFTVLWAINNWFQGNGMPPCSKLLTNWFSPSELGKQWGIWNASHQVGGAIIIAAGGFMMLHTDNWSLLFTIPAIFAIFVSIIILIGIKNRPESLGLPPVEIYKNELTNSEEKEYENAHGEESTKDIFNKYILKNKMVWIVSIANLFVYIVRIGVLDWAPSFLMEARGFPIDKATYITSAFELSGIIGALAAGWLSDKLFKGYRGKVSVIFMLLLVVSVYSVIIIPKGQFWLMLIALFFVGFFVYGPMLLIAVAAADFATKKAVATAVGLTGLFGYIGATICSIATGYITDFWGWDAGIYFYLGSAIIGTILLAFTWNKRSELLDAHHE